MKVSSASLLQKDVAKVLLDLNEDKEAVLISNQDKPSAVLIDAKQYSFMQERIEYLERVIKSSYSPFQ